MIGSRARKICYEACMCRPLPRPLPAPPARLRAGSTPRPWATRKTKIGSRPSGHADGEEKKSEEPVRWRVTLF
ncbi:hypothetical protein FPOAC1_002025 [Fusarium poae]|uniref:hypothetical protein n=1 Tax=Fusarium poae TaxID=36050 RepID=UPI001CEAE2D4|nr:hypothetical protein FPOAC1_002025 [Fusarium poae]KAG8676029.1 hypothetical protein FPOAC1_002025 [Fusarium poae]